RPLPRGRPLPEIAAFPVTAVRNGRCWSVSGRLVHHRIFRPGVRGARSADVDRAGGERHAVEDAVELDPGLGKVVALLDGEHAHAVQLEGERVDIGFPALDREVEMGPGRAPRLAHVAYELPDLQALPGVEAGREALEVAVRGHEAVRVLHLHHV